MGYTRPVDSRSRLIHGCCFFVFLQPPSTRGRSALHRATGRGHPAGRRTHQPGGAALERGHARGHAFPGLRCAAIRAPGQLHIHRRAAALGRVGGRLAAQQRLAQRAAGRAGRGPGQAAAGAYLRRAAGAVVSGCRKLPQGPARARHPLRCRRWGEGGACMFSCFAHLPAAGARGALPLLWAPLGRSHPGRPRGGGGGEGDACDACARQASQRAQHPAPQRPARAAGPAAPAERPRPPPAPPRAPAASRAAAQRPRRRAAPPAPRAPARAPPARARAAGSTARSRPRPSPLPPCPRRPARIQAVGARLRVRPRPALGHVSAEHPARGAPTRASAPPTQLPIVTTWSLSDSCDCSKGASARDSAGACCARLWSTAATPLRSPHLQVRAATKGAVSDQGCRPWHSGMTKRGGHAGAPAGWPQRRAPGWGWWRARRRRCWRAPARPTR